MKKDPRERTYGNYGGFGGNSPAKITGSINEFEDALEKDENHDHRERQEQYELRKKKPGRDTPANKVDKEDKN